MYIKPAGVLLIVLYATLSASAGVYMEWLYKRDEGRSDSIHVCNARIYSVGCLFLLSVYLLGPEPDLNLWRGYNAYTWALVATYSIMGLILAQVMKFFDNFVKLFISGSSIYVSAVLTATLFGRSPSMLFCASMALVTLAILLFNHDRLHPMKSKSS